MQCLMGLVSRDQFISSCVEFVSLSAGVGDGWELVNNDKAGIVWIQKTAHLTVNIDHDQCETIQNVEKDIDQWGNIQNMDKDIQDDDTSLVSLTDDQSVNKSLPPMQKLLTCIYEVHYSPSYAMPVLYCRFWNCSGELLGMEDVWSLAPLPARGWDRVSMAPHPVTGLPWVQVHPCHSAEISEMMRSSTSSDIKCNFIVTFLSLYGQAVGLNIPTDYVVSHKPPQGSDGLI